MNSGSGLAITTSCKDVEGALQFIDDLLSQDIHNLRFWGVEGVDYEVNDDGLFYRTEEQKAGSRYGIQSITPLFIFLFPKL